MPIKNLFRYWTFQVFSPGTLLREKYESFKRLLEYDKQAHDHLAVLEDLYYNRRKKDFQAIAVVYGQFASCVSNMVDELLIMCPSRYWDLKAYFKKFDFYVRFMLAPPEFDCTPPFTIGLDDPGLPDESVAGKKAAVLARLNRKFHLPVPRGFVITTNAFQYFLEANALRDPINKKLAGLDIHDGALLEKTATAIREMIIEATVPGEIKAEIIDALNNLKQSVPGDIRLAMRSSAVKEDGKASFAGQYLSLMNMKETQILNGYKEILAGKYGASALFYRICTGIADHDTPMAVLVLEMKDARAAGVMYTRELEAEDAGRLMIHSVWGQGGLLVDGRVSPDRIRVNKNDQAIEAVPGVKGKEMGLDRDTGTWIRNTDPEKQNRLSLDDTDILTLARWGAEIETHFKSPQDIEWCKDKAGRLFLLQSRPLISHSQAPPALPEETAPPDPALIPFCSGGETICPGMVTGPIFKLTRLNRLKDLPKGAIVLAAHGLPGFITDIHKMAGIIIKAGSTAGHFASIAREFGLPAMIASNKELNDLPPGRTITVDAGNCRVYDGSPSIKAAAPRPKEDIFSQSNVMAKLGFAMKFCAELRLTDPAAPSFKPEGCRSLHDIIRFIHETAMKEMFLLGQRKTNRKKGARQLKSKLPLLFYILDAGRGNESGIDRGAAEKKEISPGDIRSLPMKAVLDGLSHPDICWDETRHFDWESYDRTVMAGGIISPDNPQFGSYAVVARTYANINLRFGYHFVIIDAIWSPSREDNYISFRFSGGGGSPEGRWLRARFIAGILERLEFMVDIKSDLIDARTARAGQEKMENRLNMLGRLMGATKLMDMYLKDGNNLKYKIDEFMNGRYDFRPNGPPKVLTKTPEKKDRSWPTMT